MHIHTSVFVWSFQKEKAALWFIYSVCFHVPLSFTEAHLAVFIPAEGGTLFHQSLFLSRSLCCTSHCVTICCSKVCLSLQHSSQPLWHSSTKPVSGRWPASLRDIFTNVKAFRLCVFKSYFFSALYNTHFQRSFSVKNRKISCCNIHQLWNIQFQLSSSSTEDSSLIIQLNLVQR